MSPLSKLPPLSCWPAVRRRADWALVCFVCEAMRRAFPRGSALAEPRSRAPRAPRSHKAPPSPQEVGLEHLKRPLSRPSLAARALPCGGRPTGQTVIAYRLADPLSFQSRPSSTIRRQSTHLAKNFLNLVPFEKPLPAGLLTLPPAPGEAPQVSRRIAVWFRDYFDGDLTGRIPRRIAKRLRPRAPPQPCPGRPRRRVHERANRRHCGYYE
jgi:hypothetical protein